jgi:hypothetical protein
VISQLETGGIRASASVLPICRELGIQPPTFFEHEDVRRWVLLGRQLRAKSDVVFQRALGMVESMVAALGNDQD